MLALSLIAKDIESYRKKFTAYYGDFIRSQIKKIYKEERIRGRSELVDKHNKFFAALLIAEFMFLSSRDTNLDTVKETFGYDTIKKCLGKCGFDFDELLAQFDIPPIDLCGLPLIESGYSVENPTICDDPVAPPTPLNIKSLLDLVANETGTCVYLDGEEVVTDTCPNIN